MKVLIIEDIERWEQLITERLIERREQLITERLRDEAEITVVCSVSELEEILSSDQKFFAIALDGWLGKDSTADFLPRLLKISRIVISTSQDLKLRKEMVRAGCHAGGNKWDFVDLLNELSL